MNGTAISHQPNGLMLRVRRHGAGRDCFALRATFRRRPAFAFNLRAVLTVLAILALVFGTVCGPSAHQGLEGDAAASGKVLGKVADASGGPDTPMKDKPLGYCSGHCAAHAYSLPALFAETFQAFDHSTRWRVANDHWAQVSRTARLERPPRV